MGVLHVWTQNLSWIERGTLFCWESPTTSPSWHDLSVWGPFPLGEGAAQKGWSSPRAWARCCPTAWGSWFQTLCPCQLRSPTFCKPELTLGFLQTQAMLCLLCCWNCFTSHWIRKHFECKHSIKCLLRVLYSGPHPLRSRVYSQGCW